MSLRSTAARIVLAALAVLAVGGAVETALPDGDGNWIDRALTDAGTGLAGCGTCDGPGR